jgi:dTDP-4-amino-4,6-dideoxygalactose transaminase
VNEYEHAFARQVGAAHAVGFGYARHALLGILAARGLGPGDAVLLSPLTCKVLVLALLSARLRPVWIDVDPETLNLDPARLADASVEGARAVVFQHTYGLHGGLEATLAAAERVGVPVIEDRAQCMPVHAGGANGVAAIYSNNLLKPLPAGSGGVATTDDAELAGRIGAYRDRLPRPSGLSVLTARGEGWLHRWLLRPRLYWPLYALQRRFDAGYRPRPLAAEIESEVEARALRPVSRQLRNGLEWLPRADTLAEHRRRCCAGYAEALGDLPGVELPAPPGSGALYWFPLLTDRKPELLERARRRRVEIVAWPVRTPIFPVENEAELEKYGYPPGCCPKAERVARRLLGLPTHARIDARERERVVGLVREEAAGR